MQSFTDKYSWKVFLGPTAKDIQEHNGIYSWITLKKINLTIDRDLTEADIPYLLEKAPFTFFYFTEKNVAFLKRFLNVKRSKKTSVEIDITKMDVSGKKYSDIRWAVNKYSKLNLECLDNFKKIDDVYLAVDTWSTSLGEKYFRDFSGKNKFFLSNNFHKDCINLFIYDKDRLISFSVLSPPEDGKSIYILGKALCNEYKGLSDYADYTLYKKAIALGVNNVNLGGGSKGVIFFKNKFPGSYETLTYDGKCEKK